MQGDDPRRLIHLPPARSRRLFFEEKALFRIRANARSVHLARHFRKQKEEAPDQMDARWEALLESGDLSFGFRRFLDAFSAVCIVHLVEPEEGLKEQLLGAIERLLALPKWDLFLDGEVPIGIMQASRATAMLLLAREVLGGAFPSSLESDFLEAIAEKGVEPCLRALGGMDAPESVEGWRYDPHHQPYGSIEMRRWPQILSSTNLRAVPTMGVGFGALALLGRDSRADAWLRQAERSAQAVFSLFLGDGSYFEGLSYSSFTLSCVLPFCAAHTRMVGGIRWDEAMDFHAFLENVLDLQAGIDADGTPDVVNFSDSGGSLYAGIPSCIFAMTGDPLAQTVANRFCRWGHYLDYLWYNPDGPEAALPPRQRTVKTDLDWVVSRSGWGCDDAVVAFRSGYPANHEHADRNHIFFKVFGERLLHDAFGAAYNRNADGWILRLTEAHNAVLVNGMGHQYHDGREGTNASEATARIVRLEDRGGVAWWVSDATPAYRPVVPEVRKVVRTVVFSKPDLLILADQIDLEDAELPVELRFFPDNRDGKAELESGETAFGLGRPKARLDGRVLGEGPIRIRERKLEPMPKRSDYQPDPRERTLGVPIGEHPYIEVESAAASRHCIMTVLRASPSGVPLPSPAEIRRERDEWHVSTGESCFHFQPREGFFELLT